MMELLFMGCRNSSEDRPLPIHPLEGKAFLARRSNARGPAEPLSRGRALPVR